MVKLTLIGRLSDGLPLSRTYVDEGDEIMMFYKWRAEVILMEVSRGSLVHPKVTLVIDQHRFHYLIADNACLVTLCDTQYQQKLAFHYLDHVYKEFQKVDIKHIESFTTPYAFKRFNSIIEKIRQKYLDPRTQANIFKLNADRGRMLDVVTEEFSNAINDAQVKMARWRMFVASDRIETRWNTKLLEAIALKWAPIIVSASAAAVLIWGAIVLSEYTILTVP